MPIPIVTASNGVQFAKVAPAGVVILAAAALVSEETGLTMLVTCGTEAHESGDPHTTGEAYDFAVLGWTVQTLREVLAAFERAWQTLGVTGRFYALYERPDPPPEGFAGIPNLYVNPHATGPHLHIQRAIHTVYPPAGA